MTKNTASGNLSLTAIYIVYYSNKNLLYKFFYRFLRLAKVLNTNAGS
jgi:hypothetical protein